MKQTHLAYEYKPEVQWNLYKATAEFCGLSRQVVFLGREDKHDFIKTVPDKWQNLCVFSKTSMVSLYRLHCTTFKRKVTGNKLYIFMYCDALICIILIIITSSFISIFFIMKCMSHVLQLAVSYFSVKRGLAFRFTVRCCYKMVRILLNPHNSRRGVGCFCEFKLWFAPKPLI